LGSGARGCRCIRRLAGSECGGVLRVKFLSAGQGQIWPLCLWTAPAIFGPDPATRQCVDAAARASSGFCADARDTEDLRLETILFRWGPVVRKSFLALAQCAGARTPMTTNTLVGDNNAKTQ